MKRVPAVVALSIALFWTSSANAACISEAQCDVENCGQLETCDDAIDMAQDTPDDVSSTPVKNDFLAESPVAAAVADASCREVEICGTTQLVCD